VVLELGEVTSAEACYQFLHEETDARPFVGVEGLELDIFSLRLSLAPWLRDVELWMTQTPFLWNLVISLPLMNGVGRDKAVTMSMRRFPKLYFLKLSGLVMRKVDIFKLEHDKLVSQKRKKT
jgi:hypothetical protein